MTIADLPDENREANEVLGALDGVRRSVDRLHDVLARQGVFNITTVPQQTHVRMRALRLVFSGSAAGSVTFRFGNATYVFDLSVGQLTCDIPAPITMIERGTDVFVAVAAGALRIAYLTYLPE